MSLEIDGLTFRWRGRRQEPLFQALRAAPLRHGELVALVGPNGAGKSSLFRLLAGLLAAESGMIRLDGQDLARLPQRRRAERVFLLTQHTAMRAALAVFDVVLLARQGGRGGKASAEDITAVERVLAALGIEHLSDRLVPELSGGQQQLVAVCQALVREPEVLLLDEPTSALDLRRQLEVMQLVQRMTRERGLVTVVALHDLGLAGRFADRFLLLHERRIAADGRPSEVLADPRTGDAYGIRIEVETSRHGTLMVEPFLA